MPQQWPLEKPHGLLFKKKVTRLPGNTHTFSSSRLVSHTFAQCPTCRVLKSVVPNPRSPGPLSELTGMVVGSNQP